jgi:hypothetical protein
LHRLTSEAFEELKQRRASLNSKARVTNDDVLEIAIAYWIEAKNARNAVDNERALHALIESSFHLGATFSTKTESESKSEQATKQGKVLRDAVARATAETLMSMDVTKDMINAEFVFVRAIQRMRENKRTSALLDEYAKQASAGKKSKDSADDRLNLALNRWIRHKNQPYPDLRKAFAYAQHRANTLKSISTSRIRRQAKS